jgi:hypothetical protein
MPDTTAFLTEPRETAPRRPVADRVRDWFAVFYPRDLRALAVNAPKEAVHA